MVTRSYVRVVTTLDTLRYVLHCTILQNTLCNTPITALHNTIHQSILAPQRITLYIRVCELHNTLCPKPTLCPTSEWPCSTIRYVLLQSGRAPQYVMSYSRVAVLHNTLCPTPEWPCSTIIRYVLLQSGRAPHYVMSYSRVTVLHNTLMSYTQSGRAPQDVTRYKIQDTRSLYLTSVYI